MPPHTLSDIPTPALIVDVPVMEQNIRRMADYFAARSCKLRPHFKAHKTPEIARRQLAAGSCTGLTCATVAEAEAVVALADDVLVANEIVDSDRCRRVMRWPSMRMTIAADSIVGLGCMNVAAVEAGVTVGVLIDLNVGQNRCGVAPGDEAVALAERAWALPGLKLRGLMGYEGTRSASGRAERRNRRAPSMQRSRRPRDCLPRSTYRPRSCPAVEPAATTSAARSRKSPKFRRGRTP
jgi:D-serine deaminase-like pyridoxal phosphate-dependent protein